MAEAVTIKASVAIVIGVFICLFVGLLVTGKLQGVVEAEDLGSEGNSTRTSLISNVHTAFTLLVLLPLIIGAGLIMRYLGWFG